MKMNIKSNEYDMVFFNEVIFKFYKFQYNNIEMKRNLAYYNGDVQVKSSEE